MAKTRRAYTGASIETVTTSDLLASPGSYPATVTVTAATNWPYGSDPYYVVLSPGTASEEKILVTRTGASDTSVTIAASSDRGQDGTSAVFHGAGATIYPVFTAVDADEANELTSMWEAKGDIITHGTSTFSRLAVGTNDYVLKANSAAPNGLQWTQVDTNSIANDAVTNAKIDAAAVDTSELAANAVTEAKLATAIVNRLIPAGTIAATVNSSADTGWVLMGTTISNAQTLYPSLWSVAPTGWRSGSSLVLPSMENRYLTGKSGSETLGAHEGSNDVTLSTANLPSHTHSGPSHNHTINHGHADNISANQSSHTHSVNPPDTTVTINANTLDIVYNTNDYNVTNYIATDTTNASYYSASDFGMAVDSDTSHSHTGSVNIASFTSGSTDPAITVSGGVTDHSGSSGSAGTGATGSTGSGTSFDIQGARLIVNFQIKAH